MFHRGADIRRIDLAVALVVALAVALASTLVPAIRAARMSTVSALSIHAAVDQKFSHFASLGRLVNPDVPRAEQVLDCHHHLVGDPRRIHCDLHGLGKVLDARRASAVTLALGATPQQLRAGLAMTQVIAALPESIPGVCHSASVCSRSRAIT